MQYQALLFDLDGTLVDSHHEICLALECALVELGITLPFAAIERMVDGSPLEVVWERVLVEQTPEASYEHFAQGYRRHYMRDIGYKTALFPGVVDTLEALAASASRTELVLIVGMDSYRALDRWKDPERIQSLARIAVLARAESGSRAGLPDDVEVVTTRRIEGFGSKKNVAAS